VILVSAIGKVLFGSHMEQDRLCDGKGGIVFKWDYDYSKFGVLPLGTRWGARNACKNFGIKNEKADGNDLEIFVETRNGYVYFPCQAKIIKDKDKYTNIAYKAQIDLLINHAHEKKGIPAYLLYNYTKDYNRLNKMERSGWNDIECFGLSLANAISIKDNFYITENNKTF